MTEEEIFLFDLRGYLVVQHALRPAAVDELNEALNAKIRTSVGTKIALQLEFPGLPYDAKVFRDLIDNPLITPYLSALLGERFRLDHDYGMVLRKGFPGVALHGGSTPFDPAQFYLFADGRPRSGLTAVAYNLDNVRKGDRGFACIPGSHKSNTKVPPRWREPKTWTDPGSPVEAVCGEAGSAIVFTEALAHGAFAWAAATERRTLFYKYGPCTSSYAVPSYHVDELENLTVSQKRILEGPNARYAGREKLIRWIRNGKPVKDFDPNA